MPEQERFLVEWILDDGSRAQVPLIHAYEQWPSKTCTRTAIRSLAADQGYPTLVFTTYALHL